MNESETGKLYADALGIRTDCSPRASELVSASENGGAHVGYQTTFSGAVGIEPPLNSAEREYLRRFANSRRVRRSEGPYWVGSNDSVDSNDALKADGPGVLDNNSPPREQPGLWCQWVPTDDGRALVWNGHEKFYRSSGWMRYLIDTFLRPGATLKNELRYPLSDSHYPEELASFTFDHVCTGEVLATGQDGAKWRIEVIDNDVAVREICGPAPVEYVVFVFDRNEDFNLTREFDAAHDIGKNTFSRLAISDPRAAAAVRECVRAVHPDATEGVVDGCSALVDDSIGLRVSIQDDCVRVGLLAERALPDAERTFSIVQRLVAEFSASLGWISYDPAQRAAVRPTDRFRQRAIDIITGWTQEPQGTYMWAVV